MDTVWWVLGGVVLVATLLDVVPTALSDDEAGFLAGPFSRVLWSTPPARSAVQAALAVGAGSVEQRPAAVWSVTYDVRYPVRALERGAGRARDLRGPDRDAVRAVTAQHTAALVAVLEHREGPTVRQVSVVDGRDASGDVLAVLHRLDRVDQALVVLISRPAPDAVEPVDDDTVRVGA
ncbi:hypothetical protein H9657_00470 [Cellulomonas sp. Sa3CUA2]|uniref:Uncharacterized protein n=1 Tax=Cellulomonas avistercoris TaxID=2762242 RepID=A0ABR8Q8K1_9CELL|nr:hypothetical protein [Cellulomonas avistercoris]MBD7916757.1 hypothetical protein [Cellulomonas avistercoris]